MNLRDPRINRIRLIALGAVALLGLISTAAPHGFALDLPSRNTNGADQKPSENEADFSLWEVSTRCASRSICCIAPTAPLPVTKLAGGCWVESSESELIQQMLNEPRWTILFVHGNRTNSQIARQHSLSLLRYLKNRSKQPVRLISVSWPSEKCTQVALPSQLVEQKKQLIRATAGHLSYLIDRLPEQEVDALVGFSFGCAVVASALHLKSGGDLGGAAIQVPPKSDTERYRVGLIAPAFERGAFSACGEFSRAAESIDSLVNLYNSQDPVLRRFRFFDREHPFAAGYAGLLDARFEPLSGTNRFSQFDCCGIGSTHGFNDYLGCPAFLWLLDSVLANH
jgi:hypothetical protein